MNSKTQLTLFESFNDLIEQAISEINAYLKMYDIPNDSGLVKGHIRVLQLIQKELNKHRNKINERVLRAFKDVCTSTAIETEDAIFADSIFRIEEELLKMFPNMKDLDLLREEFGKGDPI